VFTGGSVAHRPERAALGDMLRLNAPNPVLAGENSSTLSGFTLVG